MTRETITQRAHGIDVSAYQESYDPNKTWGQTDFAIAKIGEGYNTPYSTKALGDETDFMKLWSGVAQIPIRGVYFYQRSGYSWQQQADMVLNYITKAKLDLHMLWLDLEKINNVIDKSFIADTARILDYWKRNTKITVGLYANPDVINNYVIPIGTKNYGAAWVQDLMKYPQWEAQYWFIKSPDKNPSPYNGFPNWDIWQYTDSGDSRELRNGTYWRHYGSPDLNVYNGTVAEMKTWLGIDQQVVTPPTDNNPPPTTEDEIESVTIKYKSGKVVVR